MYVYSDTYGKIFLSVIHRKFWKVIAHILQFKKHEKITFIFLRSKQKFLYEW